jgi:hypothetical protein
VHEARAAEFIKRAWLLTFVVCMFIVTKIEPMIKYRTQVINLLYVDMDELTAALQFFGSSVMTDNTHTNDNPKDHPLRVISYTRKNVNEWSVLGLPRGTGPVTPSEKAELWIAHEKYLTRAGFVAVLSTWKKVLTWLHS